MNKIDLIQFLDNGAITKDCFDILEREISLYIVDVKSQKGVKNIYSQDDIEYPFSRDRLVRLLNSYLEEKILEWDLEYLSSYIELSFEIEDEKIEEVLFNFSDPHLGYPITSKNVKDSISFLQDSIDNLALCGDTSNKELRSGYRSKFLHKSN